MSCPTANDCVSVGADASGQVLVEVFTGSAWKLQAAPTPVGAVDPSLNAVSCPSAAACIAVGSYYELPFPSGPIPLAEVWNGHTWKIENAATPAGASGAELFGVSCTAADACTAVGDAPAGSGEGSTLAEAWNGSSWTIQSTPTGGSNDSFLRGVSCTSATACTAVGSGDGTLAEAWNGTSWSIQSTPNPSGTTNSILFGVSCPSTTACTAVGEAGPSDQSAPLAEAWNGSSWSIQSTPNPSGTTNSVLRGVSCASSTACTAVGEAGPPNQSAPLAEAWNGASWSIQSTPTPRGSTDTILLAVSCPSSTACTAVGDGSAGPGSVAAMLAEAFDAGSWSIQPTPNHSAPTPTDLQGVSCTSSTACTAVGYFAPSKDISLAEIWNGHSWHIQSTPTPSPTTVASVLSGVSCANVSACVAVGYYEDSTNRSRRQALAEVRHGDSWTIESVPVPTGTTASQLNGVSCASVRACTAVGSYDNGKTLAESWNGIGWSVQSTPNPGSATVSALNAVSCTAAAACNAVGDSHGSGTVTSTLAETWDGSSWSIQSTPNPAGPLSELSGVSCPSPGACTAVGTSTDGSGDHLTLAEALENGSWSIQDTPNPGAGDDDDLLGVSCTASDWCTAVGSDGATLAEVWDGESWSAQSTPSPTGPNHSAVASSLNGVSCTAVSVCAAVGDYGGSGVTEQSFAEAES